MGYFLHSLSNRLRQLRCGSFRLNLFNFWCFSLVPNVLLPRRLSKQCFGWLIFVVLFGWFASSLTFHLTYKTQLWFLFPLIDHVRLFALDERRKLSRICNLVFIWGLVKVWETFIQEIWVFFFACGRLALPFVFSHHEHSGGVLIGCCFLRVREVDLALAHLKDFHSLGKDWLLMGASEVEDLLVNFGDFEQTIQELLTPVLHE